MDKHFLARGLSALLLASMGTLATAQEDDDGSKDGERRVRIDITKNENGRTSHVTREFDLNNDDELHDALRELGVIDELSTIGDGENVVLDLRRMTEGGLLNDMSMALCVPAPPDPEDFDVERGAYLGVSYESWEAKKSGKDLPVKRGALVTAVVGGSSAERAGLSEGDVIVYIGGRTIADGSDLASAVDAHQPGEQVKIVYFRGKQKKTVTVELGEREASPGLRAWNWSGGDSPDWEAYFGDAWAPEEEGAFLGVVGGSTEDDSPGVRIGEVVEGSTAEGMGLKEGDVLRSINGKELDDFGDLADEVGEMAPGDEVKVDVLRGTERMKFEGTLGKSARKTWTFNGTMPPMAPMAPMAPLPPDGYDLDAIRQRADEVRARADEARARGDEARARNDEMRAQMDELRQEMDRLRRELRSDVTREMRVTINTLELSPEERALLKGKGVAAVDSPLEVGDLQCYPNPSEGSFRLSFQVPERGDLTVDLHDATGERVYHEVISGFKGSYDRTLDLSDRSAGTYFAVIQQGGKARTVKLVKK